MCIDSGIFRCKYKKDSIRTYDLTTYGINMYSINTIRNHLKSLIPNVLLFSNNFGPDDYCYTCPVTGVISLNEKIFGKDLDKRIEDKNLREHHGFILAKNLFHEIFGHKKSLLCKEENKYFSPVCFKDKAGNLKFLILLRMIII